MAALTLAIPLVGSRAHAQTVRTWNVTSGTWSTAGSWLDSIVPAGGDSAVFSGPAVGSGNAQAFLSGPTSILGLSFVGGGTTTIRSADATTQTLTLGRGGLTVDATAGAVTIGSVGAPVTVTLSGSTGQTWTNNSASMVTLSSRLERVAGATLALAGSGTFTMTGGTNTSGILGPWATVGTGTSTRYVAVGGGDVLAAYTGATAVATGAGVTDTSGTMNYDVAATGNFTNGASFNTLRYTGTSPASTMGGSTRGYSLKGILNSSTATLTMTGTLTGCG